MFRFGIASAALAACFAMAGCATPTQQSEKVRIVGAPQEVQGCTNLGNVRGDQNIYGGVLFAGAAFNDAINQMKNKTAELGGNRLLVVTSSTGLGGSNAIGDAYRCP